jgi:hypothetical protein
MVLDVGNSVMTDILSVQERRMPPQHGMTWTHLSLLGDAHNLAYPVDSAPTPLLRCAKVACSAFRLPLSAFRFQPSALHRRSPPPPSAVLSPCLVRASSMYSHLRSLLSALCSLLSALCSLLSALCSPLSALRYLLAGRRRSTRQQTRLD